jgi:hypothetical protein
MGDEELGMQIINSVKRQITDEKEDWPSIKHLMKFISAALKPGEYKKKIQKLSQIWQQFEEDNKGSKRMLEFIKMDEKLIKAISEPFK